MTPTTRTALLRRAQRLWDLYKCDTSEYKRIADTLHMRTTELTSHCWKVNHDKEFPKGI